MTISLTRPNSIDNNDSRRNAPVGRVVPADVWDVDSREGNRLGNRNVRTLGAPYRNYGSVPFERIESSTLDESPIETRREKTGAALLGAMFGIVLIVGSAFGGAFSGGDAGFDPTEMGSTMAAVTQY